MTKGQKASEAAKLLASLRSASLTAAERSRIAAMGGKARAAKARREAAAE